MKRAFVGFSSPIGYSYGNPQTKTQNDTTSSPSPVIFGSMGLLTLYDEIWFACESLCPARMRTLPYVKFLDQHGPKVDLKAVDFKKQIESVYELARPHQSADLNDMFPEGFNEGMTKYLGSELATDNHTHGLNFLGVNMRGNPDLHALVCDICLLDRFKNLNFDLALNPLTAKISSADVSGRGFVTAEQLGLADKLLTFGNFYDITGPDGPYHECVEELRNDDLISAFRVWMTKEHSRLDNQNIEMIEKDVNQRVADYCNGALRNSVRSTNLKNVVIKVARDECLGKIPGLSALLSINDSILKNSNSEENQWKVFIALAQNSITNIQ